MQRTLNGWPPFKFDLVGSKLRASVNSANVPVAELRKMLGLALGLWGADCSRSDSRGSLADTQIRAEPKILRLTNLPEVGKPMVGESVSGIALFHLGGVDPGPRQLRFLQRPGRVHARARIVHRQALVRLFQEPRWPYPN